MPVYVFQCPEGHAVELRMHVDDRDIRRICETHHAMMKRTFVPALVVNWAGKFGNRWAKIRDGDW